MWSDNETEVDLLQFKYLASSITKIIKSPSLLPTTIGVFGDWGSGKSSLLKMVQKDLMAESDVLCLTFNGWLFEGFEDAKTALMGTILDEFNDSKRLTPKGIELLGKLMKRVNWFQLAGMAGRYALPALAGVPQISLVNAAQDIWSTLKGKSKEIDIEEAKKLLKEAPEGQENIRRNIRDFRKDFSELLKETKFKSLVVFIDDLDRCLPDTIIETLEAIRLFLFVPGTAFILGADERLVEYAVRQRFPELPGTETEVGRDYLEKLVQFPIRIPPLSGSEIESYINLLFTHLHLAEKEEDYKKVCESVAKFKPTDVCDLSFNLEIYRNLFPDLAISTDLEGDFDLTLQISHILTPGLGGNPRRTKRFLNTLLLRMELGKDRGLDLYRQILAKLMLLEYLKPEFFKQLARLQANQSGKPKELNEVENFLRKLISSQEEASVKLNETEQGEAKAKSKNINTTESTQSLDQLPTEIQPWLADNWMRNWLASDPPLKDTDLRPYFYIAHDTVGALDGTQTRLSPAAREVLNKLLDSQEFTRTLGLSRSANLSGPDATAVFESLAQRIRQAENLDDNSPHKTIFKMMEHRCELIPQLVTLYGSLAESKIPAATPGLLYEVSKVSSSLSAVIALLERWSRSSKRVLAQAAKAILNRVNSRQ